MSGGSASDRFTYTQTVGVLGSYLEGATFDMLMGYGTGWSVSSIQYLLSANNANMPIYQITPANASTVLPQLSVTSDVSTDISNALNAGLDVVTHQAPIAGGASGEVGQGYIMYDPNTGAGAYQVSTGLSGGASQDCGEPQKVPLQQIIQAILYAAVIAAAIAIIIASGGILAGGLAAAGSASEAMDLVLTAIGLSGVTVAASASAAGKSSCMAQMRVQLQTVGTGDNNILSLPVINTDPPGVTVSQVIIALEWIYERRVTVRKQFDSSRDVWLRATIDLLEAKVRAVQAAGGWPPGSSPGFSELSPDGVYRVDLENLRGDNLRF